MTMHPSPSPRGRLLWAFVDLDGTLAQPVWTPENPTSDIGPAIPGTYAKLAELCAAGLKIWIHTSRPDTDYEAIEMWFEHYYPGIPLKGIRTGKPLAAVYIDDRGRHSGAKSWLPGGDRP